MRRTTLLGRSSHTRPALSVRQTSLHSNASGSSAGQSMEALPRRDDKAMARAGAEGECSSSVFGHCVEGAGRKTGFVGGLGRAGGEWARVGQCDHWPLFLEQNCHGDPSNKARWRGRDAAPPGQDRRGTRALASPFPCSVASKTVTCPAVGGGPSSCRPLAGSQLPSAGQLPHRRSEAPGGRSLVTRTDRHAAMALSGRAVA